MGKGGSIWRTSKILECTKEFHQALNCNAPMAPINVSSPFPLPNQHICMWILHAYSLYYFVTDLVFKSTFLLLCLHLININDS